MKILLSCIGSRGDVQPLLALALELQAMGQEVVLCVPPNFKDWVESFALGCIPVGPDVQQGARRIAEARHPKPSRAQWRELARHSVGEQFRASAQAARGCGLIVAGGALQTAARSVAEALGIPYVYAAYCPAALPSADHPPPKIRSRIRSQSLPAPVNRLLWAADERNWNRLFRDAVNEQRAALGLLPVRSVPRHVSTDHPWLAADPVLAPAASAPRLRVMQTGAWMLSDPAALPDQLDQFLADGEPPIYFGFGSMQAAAGTGRALVEAARILGRRAVISRGWGGLSSTDAATDAAADCIAIGDVSHEKLFARVAAIVHHGGAGTTTAAARAGKPQVVIPHLYDQYYWAHRVRSLGIGSIGPAAARLSAEVLADALREALRPQVAAPAHALAGRIELHGARIAAQRLIERFV